MLNSDEYSENTIIDYKQSASNVHHMCNYVKDKYMQRFILLEKRLTYIEEDIEIRIESIKALVDEKLHLFQERMDKVHDELKYKNSKIRSRNRKTKAHKSKDSAKRAKIEKENIGIKLDKIFSLMKEAIFTVNDIIPSFDMIGVINSSFVNFETLKKSDIRRVDFSQEYHVTDMCVLDDGRILITNELLSEIALLNKNHQDMTRISSIGNVIFRAPCGICKDKYGNVYVCDKNNDRILLIDKNISKVQQIITDAILVQPFYATINAKFLYVLDNDRVNAIKKFSIDGNYCNSILLNHQKGINIEKVSLKGDVIFGLNRKHGVYIFDMNGNLIKNYLTPYLMSISVIDDYLFTLNASGCLCAYDTDNLRNNNETQNAIYEKRISDPCMALNFCYSEKELFCYFQWSKTISFDSHILILNC